MYNQSKIVAINYSNDKYRVQQRLNTWTETSAKAGAKVLDEENFGFCSKKMEKVSDKYEFLDVIARMRGL